MKPKSSIFSNHVFLIETIYFYFSMAFLMCRTSALFLLASSIFENSKKPLKIFRSIPNEGWCQEIERFSEQIKSETNSLTGMNFFNITRKALLGLAGTILTYELVLLQYNTDKGASGDPPIICRF